MTAIVNTYDRKQIINNMFLHMWPDFEKLTKLSHLIFQEIPISNNETTMVFLCSIIAMLDIKMGSSESQDDPLNLHLCPQNCFNRHCFFLIYYLCTPLHEFTFYSLNYPFCLFLSYLNHSFVYFNQILATIYLFVSSRSLRICKLICDPICQNPT